MSPARRSLSFAGWSTQLPNRTSSAGMPCAGAASCALLERLPMSLSRRLPLSCVDLQGGWGRKSSQEPQSIRGLQGEVRMGTKGSSDKHDLHTLQRHLGPSCSLYGPQKAECRRWAQTWRTSVG